MALKMWGGCRGGSIPLLPTMNKLPKGYRVTVTKEQGLYLAHIWYNGNYAGSSPTLHDYRDDAREAGRRIAWEMNLTTENNKI